MDKIFIMFGIILVASCGADPDLCTCEDIEHCFVETTEDFFEVYYKECSDHCTKCATWAEMCKFVYTKDECIWVHWYAGARNLDCAYYKDMVDDWIIRENCTEYLTTDACAFTK
jgi:hypothetical protein